MHARLYLVWFCSYRDHIDNVSPKNPPVSCVSDWREKLLKVYKTKYEAEYFISSLNWQPRWIDGQWLKLSHLVLMIVIDPQVAWFSRFRGPNEPSLVTLQQKRGCSIIRTFSPKKLRNCNFLPFNLLFSNYWWQHVFHKEKVLRTLRLPLKVELG